MTHHRQVFRGGPIFDGETLHQNSQLVLEKGAVLSLEPESDNHGCEVVDLEGDTLSPGFVDLQVNGGDGVMFNDAPTVETLRRMAIAHERLGTSAILPTLITDDRDTTRAAINAAQSAVSKGVKGIAGLHLEGPHLSVVRKGAHSAGLIRKMDASDLALLLEAAETLPALMLTIAPENVALEQVQSLVNAGVVVSLGHTDADFDTCKAYAAAGAHCATHLFNAMSQLGNRNPGLVGAVLDSGSISAGLIADGIHVHPSSIRIAMAAKQGPGQIFLVSDSMACAGSDVQSFEIDGRTVLRNGNRLTLQDGTLAGADLDLSTAVKTMVEQVGLSLERALRAATSIPADLMGIGAKHGRLIVGQEPHLIRLDKHFDLKSLTPSYA